MLVRALEQLCQVRLQAIPTRILSIDAVISLFHLQKVIMDIRKIVKHIPETHVLWVFAQLELVRSTMLFLFSFLFHGVSRITLLTPFKWVGPTHSRETTLEMPAQRDTYIKPQFRKKIKCFFKKKRCGLTQEGGFSSHA